MIYNEEAFFVYLAEQGRKQSNIAQSSVYLEKLMFKFDGDQPTAEIINEFMENIKKTGSGTGLGTVKMAYQAISDFAAFCADTGEFDFVYAYEEHIRQAFEEPVRNKMNEWKNQIAYIPDNTKINQKYLDKAGLTNDEFVQAFRGFQEMMYKIYEAIEHSSPFAWGWADWRGLTVGGIKYNRVILAFEAMAKYHDVENGVLVVNKKNFYGYDFHKTGEGYSKEKTDLLVKGMMTAGLHIEGIEDKESDVIKVSTPNNANVVRIIHAVGRDTGANTDYRKVQNPATLPPPTDFRGIFNKHFLEYDGTEINKAYYYNGVEIAWLRWDKTEKKLAIKLKNILLSDEHKQEITIMPNKIKQKFKLRPRKPCPCGNCYKDDRNEKVFEYTYEGISYETCEKRWFYFTNPDLGLIPIYIRLLEMEYGLKKRTK